MKENGDALFRSRKYVEALAVYDQSYALRENPRVLYNKARALEALGRFGEAYETLLRFRGTSDQALRKSVPGLDGLIGELREKVSEVRIQVNVEGAEIILGDRIVGVSPLEETLLVNAGKTTLRVEKEGFFEHQREVMLRGGGTASFEVSLESNVERAKLEVRSAIPRTRIFVDDAQVGLAPTEVVLAVGEHEVRARTDGHSDATRRVVLEAGEHRIVQLDPLSESSALYEKWWFWTGVGVVAAGAVTTVFLLNSGDDPTTGDFSPSSISAPLIAY